MYVLWNTLTFVICIFIYWYLNDLKQTFFLWNGSFSLIVSHGTDMLFVFTQWDLISGRVLVTDCSAAPSVTPSNLSVPGNLSGVTIVTYWSTFFVLTRRLDKTKYTHYALYILYTYLVKFDEQYILHSSWFMISLLWMILIVIWAMTTIS